MNKAVSLDSELAEWLEAEAERQNRSVSNLMETILLNKRQAQEAEEEAPRLPGFKP